MQGEQVRVGVDRQPRRLGDPFDQRYLQRRHVGVVGVQPARVAAFGQRIDLPAQVDPAGVHPERAADALVHRGHTGDALLQRLVRGVRAGR